MTFMIFIYSSPRLPPPVGSLTES